MQKCNTKLSTSVWTDGVHWEFKHLWCFFQAIPTFQGKYGNYFSDAYKDEKTRIFLKYQKYQKFNIWQTG